MGRTEVHGRWVYEVERDPSGSCQWHTVSPLAAATSRNVNDSQHSVRAMVAVTIVGLAVALSSSQPSVAVRTAMGVLVAALVLRLVLRRLFSLGVKHQVTVMIVEGLGVQIEVAQVTTTTRGKTPHSSNSSSHSGSSSNASSTAMPDSQPRVVHRQLVPLNTIAAAVITEIVTPTSCHFALVLLLADSDQPLPVFRHLKPPLPVLVGIRRAIESCLTA
ncbi:unnamed protein product [Closterium sp. Yama58-4]|nr:unnamed protein product [Closterium sp. Yama58-4]